MARVRCTKLQFSLCILQLIVIGILALTFISHSSAKPRPATTRSVARARQAEAGQTTRKPTIFDPDCDDSPFPTDYLLDIAVVSVCDNRHRRDTIRKGWASFARSVS
jgi:hypothetical protein